MRTLGLNIAYLCTKFDNSRFSFSGNMIEGVEIKNASCNPAQAHVRGALSSES